MNNLRKLALGSATLAAFLSFAASAGAQQQPQPITVTKIKDNVYWARGGAGSNDGIIVGKTGVILVDTKTTVDSEKGSDRRNRQNHSHTRDHGHYYP